MPREPLEEDRESLEAWEKLAQNKPSKQALPPAAGGMRYGWALLLGFIVLIILALLLQQVPA